MIIMKSINLQEMRARRGRDCSSVPPPSEWLPVGTPAHNYIITDKKKKQDISLAFSLKVVTSKKGISMNKYF